MSKRGQVTTFMIVGLFTLLVFGVIISLSGEKAKNEYYLELSGEQALVSYVESCLISTAEKGLFQNSKAGGYFLLPEHSTTDLFENLPYFYEGGQTFFPSNSLLAEQVGTYVDTMLSFCLDDFRLFQEQSQCESRRAFLNNRHWGQIYLRHERKHSQK